MNRIFSLFIVSLLSVCVFANEFTVINSDGYFYKSSSDSNLCNYPEFQVFVAKNVSESSKLVFSSNEVSLEDCELFSYADAESEKFVKPDFVSDDGLKAYFGNVSADMGYVVKYGDETCDGGERCKNYIWITSYKPVDGVSWDKEEAFCETLPLAVSPRLTYKFHLDKFDYGIKRSLTAKYATFKKVKGELVDTTSYTGYADTLFRIDVPVVNTPICITEEGYKWSFVTDTFFSQAVVAFPEMRVGLSAINELDNVDGCDTVPETGEIVRYFDDVDGMVNFRTSGPLMLDFYSSASELTSRVEWNIEHDNVAFPSIYEQDVIGYKFDEAGSYLIKLVVYNLNGDCSREYESRFVISDSELYIPNTFTPNGDGKNDEFRVAYRSIASFECKIYNQWERLVYESEDITEGWDGKIDGRDASPGVYFYIIEAKGIDGQNFDKKGSLNLIRVKE